MAYNPPNVHPHKALELITGPTDDIVTLDEMKLHLKVESNVDEDDLLIQSLIDAASEQIEMFTRRAFISQEWDLFLDDFPPRTSQTNKHSNVIELPMGPAISVGSVNYFDEDDVEITIDVADYQIDIKSDPARLSPLSGETWPEPQDRMNAVRIRFTAGYGDSDAIPERVKTALKVLVGAWYENRSEIEVQGTPKLTGIQERILWGLKKYELK